MNRDNITISLPLMIALCFLVSLTLGFVFLWPRYDESVLLQKNIQVEEEEIAKTEEYFSNLNQIKTSLDQYQDKLSKIDSSLPKSPSIPSLFNYLQRVTSQSGLILKTISSFSISSSKDYPLLQEIKVSFEVSGNSSSFKNLLSSLETSARLVEVEGISFSFAKSGLEYTKGEENFNFYLNIKTHSY